MDLEIILFSQLSQIEKDKYCILSLDIWNLKLVQMDENNDIEKNSRIYRINECSPVERESGKGQDRVKI